jgi:hypothetical protein
MRGNVSRQTAGLNASHEAKPRSRPWTASPLGPAIVGQADGRHQQPLTNGHWLWRPAGNRLHCSATSIKKPPPRRGLTGSLRVNSGFVDATGDIHRGDLAAHALHLAHRFVHAGVGDIHDQIRSAGIVVVGKASNGERHLAIIAEACAAIACRNLHRNDGVTGEQDPVS